MTTYTIAIDKISGMLLATSPDGNEKMMGEILSGSLSQFTQDEIDNIEIEYTRGLTLYDTEEEAEESDAYVIYSGTEMGWLMDEKDNSYEAAGFAK